MKHTVTVGVTVQAYAQIEVEAASMSEAMKLVDSSIEKTGWGSPFWLNATFKPDWAGADDLRVVGMDDLPVGLGELTTTNKKGNNQ